MFSCVRSVLMRPERSLFKFKLDLSVSYFLTFLQTVILVGETLTLFRALLNLFKASSQLSVSIAFSYENPIVLRKLIRTLYNTVANSGTNDDRPC